MTITIDMLNLSENIINTLKNEDVHSLEDVIRIDITKIEKMNALSFEEQSEIYFVVKTFSALLKEEYFENKVPVNIEVLTTEENHEIQQQWNEEGNLIAEPDFAEQDLHIENQYSDISVAEHQDAIRFQQDLSVRAFNILSQLEVKTKSDLLELSEEDLWRARNAGQKTVNEVLEYKDKMKSSEQVEIDFRQDKIDFILNQPVKVYLKNSINSPFLDYSVKDFITESLDTDNSQVIQIQEQLKSELFLNRVSLEELFVNRQVQTLEEIIKDKLASVSDEYEVFYYEDGQLVKTINPQRAELPNKIVKALYNNNLINIDVLLDTTFKDIQQIRNLGLENKRELLHFLLEKVIVKTEDEWLLGQPLYIILERYGDGILKSISGDFPEKLKSELNQIIIKENLEGVTLSDLYHQAKNNLNINNKLKSIQLNREQSAEIVSYFIAQYSDGISRERLLTKIGILLPNIDIEQALAYLREEDRLYVNRYSKIQNKKQGVLAYAKRHLKPNRYQVLSERLKGKTLQQIGDESGRSRQRIDQVLNQAISELNTEVFEDRYALIYETYDLSEDEFKQILKVTDEEYNYLKVKYKKGKDSKETLYEQNLLDEESQMLLFDVINQGYVIVGNEKIKKVKRNILKYLIRHCAYEYKTFEEMNQIYNKFIDEHQLEQKLYNHDVRYIENSVVESNIGIRNGDKMFRYYDFSQYDWIHFYSIIDFKDYMNSEISTEVFFRNYPELMKDYDINNRNELHFIIRNTMPEKDQDLVVIKKMPTLHIGNVDREKQVHDLLLANNPISQHDFIMLYSETYGIDMTTLKANDYLGFIEKYLSEGTYNILKPHYYTSEHQTYLSAVLDGHDIYFIDDLKAEFNNHFNHPLVMSKSLFESLGYKIYTSYIISNQFANSRTYFMATYFNEEFADIREMDGRVNRLSSFQGLIYDFVYDNKFLEYNDRQYISISRLEKMGITKAYIDQLRHNLINSIKEQEIVSVKELLTRVSDNKLSAYGYDDVIHKFILRQAPDIRVLTVGGSIIVSRQKNPLSFNQLLHTILDTEAELTLSDLKQILEENYGIILEEHKLRYILHTETDYELTVKGEIRQK